MQKKGFTLIELLIVIAIIAIIAGVVFVALDPLRRFQDARDARRWSDIAELANAIKIDQVDNQGPYLTAIADATAGQVYLIGDCAAGATGAPVIDYCTTDPTQAACLDLGGLVTQGYLGQVPISPNGDGTWSASTTGYTLQKDAVGIITIRSCEEEGSTTEISVVR
ncbi:prepilin-type N-terminal cleavage/methylation domain-containing protein [Patescibacteria group bacterium]|nr:prepilin-type N-terminal cleavage/methylation domain-containing protein [Patescibacteria group bacterium]MBU1721170.1 prepilin-type N-terminal cleavage/methylation domain-containing protein [Patescibacteria group bacterium]MBU1900900.1 prepilin-type N-terminal cleavage/methylation domain-containing protein [Patescibacteria group bacterium]